jgi:hypothetical protein
VNSGWFQHEPYVAEDPNRPTFHQDSFLPIPAPVRPAGAASDSANIAAAPAARSAPENAQKAPRESLPTKSAKANIVPVAARQPESRQNNVSTERNPAMAGWTSSPAVMPRLPPPRRVFHSALPADTPASSTRREPESLLTAPTMKSGPDKRKHETASGEAVRPKASPATSNQRHEAQPRHPPPRLRAPRPTHRQEQAENVISSADKAAAAERAEGTLQEKDFFILKWFQLPVEVECVSLDTPSNRALHVDLRLLTENIRPLYLPRINCYIPWKWIKPSARMRSCEGST